VRRYVVAVALTILVLLASPQALRADQPVAITGTIFDLNGKPISGATVAAQSSGTTVVVRADRAGNYALLSFGGDVAITAEAIGHSPCDLAVSLESGDRVTANFRLDNLRVHSFGHYSRQCATALTQTEQYDRYVIK